MMITRQPTTSQSKSHKQIFKLGTHRSLRYATYTLSFVEDNMLTLVAIILFLSYGFVSLTYTPFIHIEGL